MRRGQMPRVAELMLGTSDGFVKVFFFSQIFSSVASLLIVLAFYLISLPLCCLFVPLILMFSSVIIAMTSIS